MNWFNIFRFASLDDRVTLLSKKYNLPLEKIKEIIPLDISKKGLYLEWLIRMVKNGVIRIPEDNSKVIERLTQFNKLKNSPKFKPVVDNVQINNPADINSYRTYGDLAKAIEYSLSGGQQSRGEQFKAKAVAGSKEIIRKGNFSVVKITSAEASSELCKGTEWCVKDPRYFEQYRINENNPLFLVFQDGQKLALINFESQQIMDKWDNPIDISKPEWSYIPKLFHGSQEALEAIKSALNLTATEEDSNISILSPFLDEKSLKDPDIAKIFDLKDYLFKSNTKSSLKELLEKYGNNYAYKIINGLFYSINQYIVDRHQDDYFGTFKKFKEVNNNIELVKDSYSKIVKDRLDQDNRFFMSDFFKVYFTVIRGKYDNLFNYVSGLVKEYFYHKFEYDSSNQDIFYINHAVKAFPDLKSNLLIKIKGEFSKDLKDIFSLAFQFSTPDKEISRISNPSLSILKNNLAKISFDENDYLDILKSFNNITLEFLLKSGILLKNKDKIKFMLKNNFLSMIFMEHKGRIINGNYIEATIGEALNELV